MEKRFDIISDFEELLKLKEFLKEKKFDAYECTYEMISRSIKNEYIANVESKIERWVNISHVLYFKDVLPVRFYFQAKMLYRDGYYEAAITMSRAICEMICYDLLNHTPHPFGDLEKIDRPIFRTLVNYLAIPKRIEKSAFENQLLCKITNINDKNYIRSSYSIIGRNKNYLLKSEDVHKDNSLKRIFKIFKDVDFQCTDSFKVDTYRYLHHIYDIGNIYVHAKRNQNPAKKDATECLNMLAHILSEIYAAKEISINQKIKSGYSNFPDICTGMNFGIVIYLTPEAAQRGYYNLPSKEEIEKLLSLKGTWEGEWQNSEFKNKRGNLIFYIDEEYLKGDMICFKANNSITKEPLDIKLFGDYFRIKGFDLTDMIHRKRKHVHFEFEFLNDNILIGKSLKNNGIAFFRRQISK